MGPAPRLLALAGTAVHAHPSWLAIWALLTVALGPSGHAASIALLGVVAAHALAQALAARAAGVRVRRVTLYPFGGAAELDGDWRSARAQALSAIVGPVVALIVAGVGLLASAVAEQTRAGLLYMVSAGLTVAAVNVLPASPLDGGRLLEAFVWGRTGRRTPGAARGSGAAVRALVLLSGVVTLVRGEALPGLLLILLGVFLRDADQVSAAALALREALLPLKVREAMTRSVVAVPPDATIAQLAETFWAYHFTSYPVIAEGVVLGIVDLRDVAAVDRERWPRTRVRAVMRALADDLVVRPGDSLLVALAKASRNGIGRVVVMEARTLTGYLSSHDITAALARRGLALGRTRAARAASPAPPP